MPEFDKKFKIIVPYIYTADSVEIYNMIMWVGIHSSGEISIKNDFERLYIGFEDAEDALVFRIKYGV